MSRSQSLIKKNIAPNDLRPSDILIEVRTLLDADSANGALTATAAICSMEGYCEAAHCLL